jgi:hypothetical protein
MWVCLRKREREREYEINSVMSESRIADVIPFSFHLEADSSRTGVESYFFI